MTSRSIINRQNWSILDMSKDEVFEILMKFTTYVLSLCLYNLELMALYIEGYFVKVKFSRRNSKN
jgi:hypothetical protein